MPTPVGIGLWLRKTGGWAAASTSERWRVEAGMSLSTAGSERVETELDSERATKP